MEDRQIITDIIASLYVKDDQVNQKIKSLISKLESSYDLYIQKKSDSSKLKGNFGEISRLRRPFDSYQVHRPISSLLDRINWMRGTQEMETSTCCVSVGIYGHHS